MNTAGQREYEVIFVCFDLVKFGYMIETHGRKYSVHTHFYNQNLASGPPPSQWAFDIVSKYSNRTTHVYTLGLIAIALEVFQFSFGMSEVTITGLHYTSLRMVEMKPTKFRFKIAPLFCLQILLPFFALSPLLSPIISQHHTAF